VLAAQLLTAAVYGVAAVMLPPQLIVVLIVPVVASLLIALWIMPASHALARLIPTLTDIHP